MKDSITTKELNGKQYNCHRETDGRFNFAYLMYNKEQVTPIIISCDFEEEEKRHKCFVSAGIRHFRKSAGVAVYIKAYTEYEQPIWVLYDTCNVTNKSFISKELDYNFKKLGL